MKNIEIVEKQRGRPHKRKVRSGVVIEPRAGTHHR
jgi:hypothetical protein